MWVRSILRKEQRSKRGRILVRRPHDGGFDVPGRPGVQNGYNGLHTRNQSRSTGSRSRAIKTNLVNPAATIRENFCMVRVWAILWEFMLRVREDTLSMPRKAPKYNNKKMKTYGGSPKWHWTNEIEGAEAPKRFENRCAIDTTVQISWYTLSILLHSLVCHLGYKIKPWFAQHDIMYPTPYDIVPNARCTLILENTINRESSTTFFWKLDFGAKLSFGEKRETRP